jgi:apolipoprotein N-acyltransferase
MKRALQIFLAVFSLAPLYFGVTGVLSGASGMMPIEAVTPDIDSQFRYLSGLYIGFTLIIWWFIPNIDRNVWLFRLMVLAIFLGGAARLFSYISVGAPAPEMIVGIGIELSLPLIIIWQTAVVRKAASSRE